MIFLVATKQLKNLSVCLSVGPSVCPSVHWFVSPSHEFMPLGKDLLAAKLNYLQRGGGCCKKRRKKLTN